MKKLILLILTLLTSLYANASPLHVESNYTIIIDTDCAIDDFRAISLLLSRPEITIEAILASEGSLNPAEGLEKISALLNEFERDTIPVAISVSFNNINPPWREFNQQLSWGSKSGKQHFEIDAVNLLHEKLKQSDEKIILVCLGSLGNVAQLIKQDASIRAKIERIIWYSQSINPVEGFNYECDKSAADYVLNSGIRIDIISNLNKADAIIDNSVYDVFQQSNTIISKVLYNVYTQPAVVEKLNQKHFRLCDDLIAIYITNPELFDINVMKKNITIRYNQDYNTIAVKEVIDDMIKGTYVSEKNIVFNGFPLSREMYRYDVRQILDSAITKYGIEEWKAIVMTDEFHGHLGVFSIVGAKMGIKAREIFGVHEDELEVRSLAGSKPPYSCLNDGIQVSTGATLGMGTIHLANDTITIPSAIFTYKNLSAQLTLKPEYLKQLNDDINEGIVKYGLMDDGYWKLVRLNAIKYWLTWDRNEIFDIKEITKE